MSCDAELADLAAPGLLYVTTQPGANLSIEEFNDWYDTEHGPLRVRQSLFENGYRYQSRDMPPVWLGRYEVKDLSGLLKPEYAHLRENRSQREVALMKRLGHLDRRVYVPFSSRGNAESPAAAIIAVTMYVKNDKVDEVDKWYEEEHIDDLSKIPGWMRSRRYRCVSGEGRKDGITELLALHDFSKDNGIDGPEHICAKKRPWRNKVVDTVIEGKDNKIWDFHRAFRAEDYRDPPAVNAVNGVSHSWFSSASFCHPATGATSWRFDGCEDADAPLIVFSNSLLTDFHLWDWTIAKLKGAFPQYRFLRYNTRGYEYGSREAVSADLLADDIAGLLDHLGIVKCHMVIGVSLGGLTAMNFAIRHPTRLDKFVACDCNVASSEKNTQAWKERIALARSEGGWNKLADQTVVRWFTVESARAWTVGIRLVREQVLKASLQGFEDCVAALCDVNLVDKIKHIQVPGLCLVGKCDGVLPKTMASFASSIPMSSFVEIAGAGHLPMVEQAQAFVNALVTFMQST